MNKKGYSIFLIIAVLAGLITILSFSGIINTAEITGGETGYIQIPRYCTITCQQKGVSTDFTKTIMESGEWISDNMPKNTNEWSIRLISDKGKWYETQRRFEYYDCPQRDKTQSNCIHKFTEWQSGGNFDFNLGTISSSRFIYVQYQKKKIPFGTGTADGSSFQVTYKPFILQRDDIARGGKTEVSGAIGCEIPLVDEAWKDRILSAVGLSYPSINPQDRNLEVGENFNYLCGTLTTITEGTLEKIEKN